MKYIDKFLIIFFIIFSCSCGGKIHNHTEQEQEQEQEQDHDHETGVEHVVLTEQQYNFSEIGSGKIIMATLGNTLKYNGIVTVSPNNEAYVSAPLGGYIKSSGLIEGQKVVKGQVLAIIENNDFIILEQNYLINKSKLTFLKQEFERQKKLRTENINSEKSFQKIEAEYNAKLAEMKGQEQTLKLIGISPEKLTSDNISGIANLRSPISGFVRTSNICIGKYVEPKDVLFELINIDNVMLKINAYEDNLDQISIGMKFKFSLSNEDNYNRVATVQTIGKSANADRTISVSCSVNDNDLKDLLPGMYIKASMSVSENKQTAVPSDAIVNYKGSDFILVQENDDGDYIFEFIPITKGDMQDGLTAILLPPELNYSELDIVTKNAYIVLATLVSNEGGGGHSH